MSSLCARWPGTHETHVPVQIHRRLYPIVLNGAGIGKHTREVYTKLALSLLAVNGLASAAGQSHATLSVSAVILQAARLEVQSPTDITVFVSMYSGVLAFVWSAADSCAKLENARVLTSSGIHHLSLRPGELRGKKMICLASSDGVLRTSARLHE